MHEKLKPYILTYIYIYTHILEIIKGPVNIQSIINEKGKNVTKLTFFKFLYKPTYACMVELQGFVV